MTVLLVVVGIAVYLFVGAFVLEMVEYYFDISGRSDEWMVRVVMWPVFLTLVVLYGLTVGISMFAQRLARRTLRRWRRG